MNVSSNSLISNTENNPSFESRALTQESTTSSSDIIITIQNNDPFTNESYLSRAASRISTLFGTVKQWFTNSTNYWHNASPPIAYSNLDSKNEEIILGIEDQSEDSKNSTETKTLTSIEKWELQQEQKEEVLSRTLFWRVKQNEIQPEISEASDKEVEIDIGILDGKFVFALIDDHMRMIPPSNKAKFLLALGLIGATLGSYAIFDEGIVTQGVISSLAPVVLPALSNIPYVPLLVGSAALSGLAYTVQVFTDNNFFSRASFMTGVAITALGFKKSAKEGAKKGWAGFKPYILPKEITELGLKNAFNKLIHCGQTEAYSRALVDTPKEHTSLGIFTIEPLADHNLNNQVKVPLQVEVTAYDNEVYLSLIIGVKKYPPKLLGSTNEDDDDDEVDEKIQEEQPEEEETNAVSDKDLLANYSESAALKEIKEKRTKILKKWKAKAEKKAQKAEKAKKNPTTLKQNVIMMAAGVLSFLSRVYIDGGQEGITTKFLISTWGGMAVAQAMHQSTLFGFGSLALASGVTLSINYLSPNVLTKSLLSLAVNPLIAFVSKEYIKNGIIKPKTSKAHGLMWYALPLCMEKKLPTIVTKLKKLGYKERAPIENIHPLQSVIKPENKHEVVLKFDINKINSRNESKIIVSALSINKGTMSGYYPLLNDNAINSIGLPRMKAKKLDAHLEKIFIATTVVLTGISAFATAKYEEASVNDVSKLNAKPGQGVLTGILNNIFVMWMKESVKDHEMTKPLLSAFTASALVANGGEYLISTEHGYLPVSLSFIPTSAAISITTFKLKKWVMNKEVKVKTKKQKKDSSVKKTEKKTSSKETLAI